MTENRDSKEELRKRSNSAATDFTWLRGMDNASLAKLDTSQRGDDRDRMIGRYMRARHSARAIKFAGIKLYA